jgi:4-hydroxy-3-polyprenylbenzoate decarboxylase
MPFGDLREYLAKLAELDELATVRKEVDPKYEVGAVCKAAHERGRKALYFERVRGASMPVVTELLTTLKRLSIALETDETDLFL